MTWHRQGTAAGAAILLAAGIVALSCSTELTQPRAPDGLGSATPDPTADIADAAHGGSAGFYFLPPLVPQPSATGSFDGTLLPKLGVEVCEWSGTACGAVVARFAASDSGGATGRLRLDGQHYAADWPTAGASVQKTYRVRVLLSGGELGHADVRLGANERDLQAIDHTKHVAWRQGETLPIKFLVEALGGTLIGSGGGSVSAQNGAVLLTVPAGALASATALTVLPPSGLPAGGGYVPGSAWDFGPAGTVFAKPATLALKFDSTKVPAGVDRRALRLMYLAKGTWVAVPQSGVNVGAGTVTGLVSHFTPYGAVQSPVDSTLLQVEPNLDSLVTVVRDSMTALSASSPDEKLALTAQLQITALQQMSGRPEYHAEADTFFVQAGRRACKTYSRYAAKAQTTAPSGWGSLQALLAPAVEWYMVQAQLGATCTPVPIDTVVNFQAKAFTSFYTAQLQSGNFDTTLPNVVSEFLRVAGLDQMLTSMSLTTTAGRLKTLVQYPLADTMRADAFANCRTRGRQTSPVLLLNSAQQGLTRYTATDVQQDIEWCASQLSWKLLRPDTSLKASGSLGGKIPGTLTTQATTQGLAQGTLRLTGNVLPLVCLDSSLNAGETLTVGPPGGTALYTGTVNPPASTTLMNGPIDIDLAALLAAENVNPAQSGSAVVQVTRTSTGCSGFYPPGSYVLATITLTYPALTVTVTTPNDTVAPGATTKFTAAVTAATNPAVVWTATGGTIDTAGNYTAGNTPGTYVVKATSVQDSTVAGTDSVVVSGSMFSVASVNSSLCITGPPPFDTTFATFQGNGQGAPLPYSVSGSGTNWAAPSWPGGGAMCTSAGHLQVTVTPIGNNSFAVDVDFTGGYRYASDPPGPFNRGSAGVVLLVNLPRPGQLAFNLNRGWATAFATQPFFTSFGFSNQLGSSEARVQWNFDNPANSVEYVGAAANPAPVPATGSLVFNAAAGRTWVAVSVVGLGAGTGRVMTVTFQ